MEFIKSIITNRKLLWNLGKNDFKNRFANTSLGNIWGFLQPFIFMITYVIVFQYIMKSPSPGDYPYVVWFLPGMAAWLTISDMVLNSSNSIRTYSYLVKKVVFPVEIIPLISIISSSFVGIFLVVIVVVVSCIFGFVPNILTLIYALICMYAFIIALTRFTSAVCTLVPDFSQLLNIIIQLCFWFTPIVWNFAMVQDHVIVRKILMSMPFTYIITAFREAVIPGNEIITKTYGIYTAIFWIITILMFLWGNHVFKKNRKDFADVL